MTLGESEALPIGLDLESDKPSGTIAITNARIITMNGDEVIQNGTIVIHENRIEAVGAASEVDVPEGAYVRDAEGKTVMPGFVDAHARSGNFRSGLRDRKSVV